MQPIVNGLEKAYGGEIEFVKVNIDYPESEPLKNQYGFRFQPHFLLVSAEGEVIEEWLGYTDAAFFEQSFATVLSGD